MKIVYEARDGKQFDNQLECEHYEWRNRYHIQNELDEARARVESLQKGLGGLKVELASAEKAVVAHRQKIRDIESGTISLSRHERKFYLLREQAHLYEAIVARNKAKIYRRNALYGIRKETARIRELAAKAMSA